MRTSTLIDGLSEKFTPAPYRAIDHNVKRNIVIVIIGIYLKYFFTRVQGVKITTTR